MTTTDHDQLTRDRAAVPTSDRPRLDSAEIGYAPPRLDVLGTLEKLAAKLGPPKMIGGSL